MVIRRSQNGFSKNKPCPSNPGFSLKKEKRQKKKTQKQQNTAIYFFCTSYARGVFLCFSPVLHNVFMYQNGDTGVVLIGGFLTC